MCSDPTTLFGPTPFATATRHNRSEGQGSGVEFCLMSVLTESLCLARMIFISRSARTREHNTMEVLAFGGHRLAAEYPS